MTVHSALGQWRARLRWWRLAGVAGLLLPLVVYQLASAAMWVRITVAPVQPVAGELARVSVQTLMVTGGANCLDDPRATVVPVSAYDWTPYLETIGPGQADPLIVEMQYQDSDPSWWDGEIVFPTPGSWMLRMARPSWPADATDTCSGAQVSVRVLPPGAQPDRTCADLDGWWSLIC